ncbi:PTS sugar transporter subunit IIA [Brachybacterium sp. GCM10030267]|uniref:PTS sugar transporter subunit IIA n=1 Tax=Brachybacterium sp. GCM10030267 TaxID=3273381 RepID=UPI0036222BB7
MSQLTALIDPAAIRLDVPAADWREAIRLSGDLLVSSDVTGAAYTEAMIRAVEEHGPYIVITPGFALAHSRPDESVHRTGMSFVRLAEPVSFGHETNDPVHLVMALAAADSSAHQSALAALAGVLADPAGRTALETASSPQQVLAALGGESVGTAPADAAPGTTTSGADDVERSASDPGPASPDAGGTAAGAGTSAPAADATEDTVPSKNLLFTVCGNGLGTSLFLKNTAEQVLSRWGWSSHLSVEATDTISAKGKAKDADAILTSGAIAQTLGDVGVPVEVIENFTSQTEVDAALRRLYAV